MIESLKRISGKKSILGFLLVFSFAIGVLQIMPVIGMPNIFAENDNSQLVDTEVPIETGFIEEVEIEQPTKRYQTAYDETHDYVDQHYYDGYGSTAAFSNMRSSSTSYATLTEAPTYSSTIDHEFLWSPWVPSGWIETVVDGQTDFDLRTDGGQGGSTSNYASVIANIAGNSGGIRSPLYDLSSVGYFVFSVYIYDYGLANQDEMRVYFRDSSGHYDYKFYWDDCGTPVNGWRYKELTITDPQYLYDGFRVRYEANGIHWLQGTGVDDHKIVTYGSKRIDQRYRFQSVDYDEFRVEQLAIELDRSVGESLKIEVWSDSEWNTVGYVSASGTTYLNVHNYLTSGTLNVRVTDTSTSHDATTHVWRIEEMYLRLYDHIPRCYSMPHCDSLYDTDNIYAMKTPRSGTSDSYAHITTFHTDGDGYPDIQYCYVAGYDGDARLWELRYATGSDSYSIIAGSNYIGFVAGTENGNGNYLDITWRIEFKFAHPDVMNMDIRVKTKDHYFEMTSFCNTNWDVETRLVSSLAATDGNGNLTRGNVDESILCFGAVTYSGSTHYPPEFAVDVFVISSEVSGSPWSIVYEDWMLGEYSGYVSADDQVGLDYYRSKIVEAGAGSGGTDLLVTDDSVGYVADRIIVLDYFESDARVNVNSGVYIYADLEYEYDNTAVTSGTVSIIGHDASHTGDGVWRILESESSVTAQTYDSVSVTSDPYGITNVNQNNQETTIIWDGLLITMTDPDESRINVSDTATGITVSAVYSYDGTVYDGTLVLNSTTFAYDTVGKRGYTVASASGDTYGITLILSNDETWCIWDGLVITLIDPDDSRINVDDTATGIAASAVYSYDGTAYDGTLVLNSTTYTYGTVGKRGYTVAFASGDTYGITLVLSNDVTWCIWDGLIISMSDPTDSRINVDDAATGITASAVYSYDGAVYDGTLVLNSTTYVHDTVGKRGYTIGSASGDSYDITVILLNDETWCIWDEVVVVYLESTPWSLVNESFEVWCNLRLAYDNHQLGAGDSVVIADQAATWNGSHFVLETSYPYQCQRSFFVNSSTENTYNISALDSTVIFLVHVTDMPYIDDISSDFEAANGLYQGVYSGDFLLIHWDPVNDPDAPSFSFTIGGAYFHSWNVTSSWSGLAVISGNSTGAFVCTLETGLPYSESNYTYAIFAMNEYGYLVTQVVYITVRDYTAPVIVENPLDVEMTEGDVGFSIIWTCSDANPQSYEIRENDTLIDSGGWQLSPENVTVSLDGLDAGEYAYEITIYDERGNFVQDLVTVVVNEIETTTSTTTTTTEVTTTTTTTTTTEAPTNTTATGITGPLDPMTISLVIMIVGVVIIVIIVIVRKR